MKEFTTVVPLYISDDGLKQSIDKSIIERYERCQREEQFEKRVYVRHLCEGTKLYKFTDVNDLHEFLKYHPYTQNHTADYFGYFVYIDDDTYHVLRDNIIIELSEYTLKLQQKIRKYNNLLANVTIK